VKKTENWNYDPFAAIVDGGRIYGWGVADDLSGVAIMTESIDAVLRSGLRPQGDVYLCSTPSKRNARGIIAVLSKLPRVDAAIYLHPAESGRGLKDIKTLALGRIDFRLKIFGRPPNTKEPGHTAFAHLGINPIEKGITFVQALRKLDEKRSERVHHSILDTEIGRSTNLLISHLVCGDEKQLGRVPEECTISASLSFPPSEKIDQVKKELEDVIFEVAKSDTWLSEHPPLLEWLFGTQGGEVPLEHPLCQTVNNAIQTVVGLMPNVNPLHGASDIRNPMLFRGRPTLGFGPLAGNFSQIGDHDEWVDIEDYINTIKV